MFLLLYATEKVNIVQPGEAVEWILWGDDAITYTESPPVEPEFTSKIINPGPDAWRKEYEEEWFGFQEDAWQDVDVSKQKGIEEKWGVNLRVEEFKTFEEVDKIFEDIRNFLPGELQFDKLKSLFKLNAKEVKHWYREKVLLYHPDKNPKGNTAWFQLISLINNWNMIRLREVKNI